MKKILVLTLVAALMVSMLFVGTSCSHEQATTEESADKGSTETEASGELIGVTMPTKSLQRWNQDGDNIK
ncbi:MAG: ABC transporter substrate-binding protein, partial [Actinomycetota bacterium]|nr:ABC transporter substrate-binding protein [Actinomycetota bacterium]